MSTGSSAVAGSLRSRRTSSRPSMPGIITSVMSAAGTAARMASSAAAPSATGTTS